VEANKTHHRVPLFDTKRTSQNSRSSVPSRSLSPRGFEEKQEKSQWERENEAATLHFADRPVDAPSNRPAYLNRPDSETFEAQKPAATRTVPPHQQQEYAEGRQASYLQQQQSQPQPQQPMYTDASHASFEQQHQQQHHLQQHHVQQQQQQQHQSQQHPRAPPPWNQQQQQQQQRHSLPSTYSNSSGLQQRYTQAQTPQSTSVGSNTPGGSVYRAGPSTSTHATSKSGAATPSGTITPSYSSTHIPYSKMPTRSGIFSFSLTHFIFACTHKSNIHADSCSY
jgi:hypothetical protein